MFDDTPTPDTDSGAYVITSVRYSARPGAQSGIVANRVVVGDPCGATAGVKPWALTDSVRIAMETRATHVPQSSNRQDPGGSGSCVSPSPPGCEATRVDYHGSNPVAQPRRPSPASLSPGDGRARCLSVAGSARLALGGPRSSVGTWKRRPKTTVVAARSV